MIINVPPSIPNSPMLDAWNRNLYKGLSKDIGFALGTWYQLNVAAAQTNVDLYLLNSTTNTELVVPINCTITAISITSNDARADGTLTVAPTVNGTSIALNEVLDGTTTQYGYTVANQNDYQVVTGDRIGVHITTSAGWLPASADIVVQVFVLF